MKQVLQSPAEQEIRQDAQEGRLPAEDVQSVFEFIDHYGTLKDLSPGSRTKYFYALRAFLRAMAATKKTLATLDESSVLALIKRLQDEANNWSEATREDYWKRWTKFYDWVHDRRGATWNAQAVALLTDAKKKYRYHAKKNRIIKKSILSPEEMLELIHAETNLCYKALFSVTFEGGLRYGEVASLQLRDVQKNGNGFVLQLRASKTERRPIFLVQFSVPYLSKWLQYHPSKGQEDAPLFLNTQGRTLDNDATNKKLRELAELAGLKKPKLSMHSLRHSRASQLAQSINEFEMRKIFGWSANSGMPSVYVRSEAIDAKKAILRASGMEKEEETKPAGKPCLRCSHLNAYSAEYCDNCSLPLDAQKLESIKATVEAIKLEEAFDKMVERLDARIIAKVEQMLKNV